MYSLFIAFVISVSRHFKISIILDFLYEIKSVFSEEAICRFK